MIQSKYKVALASSLLVLGIVAIISLAVGARWIPFNEVITILFDGNRTSMNGLVVHERIPRTVFGIIAGAALGISGVLMQSVTKNPIADPSILGINTGASLFVVTGIAFFKLANPIHYITFALIGATLTSFLVFGIASLGTGGTTPIKLALAGAATSAALSSFISAIILPRTDVMNVFRFWQVGSISGASFQTILTILPFVILGLFLSALLGTALDALSLGDELATGLGVKTKHVRFLALLSGILLCGSTTALAGPIGFVGLMVPHTMRFFSGPSLSKLIPLSALGGSILLVLSDSIGRIIASPAELEVGVVTAFLGAPILIYIATKAKVRAL